MKGVFVILDGVADEPSFKLNGKTPLEYSKTPNLDFFANRSELYKCNPIAEGIAPQSSSGVVSLLGADFRDYPRGTLESMGVGIGLNNGDIALRCNFATIESLNSLKLIDRRVGRTFTNRESRELADAINSKVRLPFKFELIPTVGHRAVLIFRGNFSSKISNVDPSYESGLSVENSKDLIEFSKPQEDSTKAILTADLINTFIRKSYVILENHNVNFLRKKKGFFPANFILCRDAGSLVLRTKALKGNWMGLGYMPLEIGIIKAFGIKLISFSVPALEKEDFYEHAELILNKAIFKAIEMIKENMNSEDYFYVHFKETDLPGHDNKPMEKVKLIEQIDKLFFGYLRSISSNFRMVVTSDHTTSCRLKRHTSDPVPVLFFDSENIKESGKRFIESDALKEKVLVGRQLLNKTLFR